MANLNPQIVQAVEKTREEVVGSAREEALAIVFQQVAQAGGMAIEDAVDNLQSLLTLNIAVVGKALEIILFGPKSKIDDAVKAITEIGKAVGSGITNLKDIGSAASQVLKEFPQPDGDDSPPGDGPSALGNLLPPA